MKAVLALILLLTCIAVNSENEGPSKFLMSKWRELYTINRQFYAPRCFRTCSPLGDDLFLNAIGGNAAQSWSETKFMEHMINSYNTNRTLFEDSVQQTVASGIRYLDIDDNGVISAEEFYTQNLCMGYGLDLSKKMFDLLKPMGNGVPNDRFIGHLVNYWTNGNETTEEYDTLKNTSLAYNKDNPN